MGLWIKSELSLFRSDRARLGDEALGRGRESRIER